MTNNSNNIIFDIKKLNAGYGGKTILNDFNLEVSKGEIVAITGANGCGKSTLLKAIYQLCKIENGTILYKGENIIGKTPENIKNLGVAYFMQKNAVFTQLKVKENLILSLNGESKKRKAEKIDKIFSAFPDIKNWMNKNTGLLSGGQRQQLSMAMLLAQNADLWLLDEPTAGLDENKTDAFVNMVLNANEIYKRTILLVEHKINVINRLTNKIINL